VRCRAAVRRAATRKNTTLLFVSRSHWERDAVPLGLRTNGATGTTQLGRLRPRLGRLGPFPKGDWALHTGDSAHWGQLARRGDWATGKAPRWGVGDDSQRRVARAGSHSAERVGARHYREPRHFLCVRPLPRCLRYQIRDRLNWV
jgi:hypothetical protein